MPVANGLVSKGKRSVIQREQQWSLSRRKMRPFLTGAALRPYGEYADMESIRMLSAYLAKPGDWHRHHARYTASVMYRSVMGTPLSKSPAELAEYQIITMQFLDSILKSPVDFFPLLRFLPNPLQIWRRKWQLMGDFHERVFDAWWQDGNHAAQEGRCNASFMRDTLLAPNSRYECHRNEAMYLANSIMAAGGDNTRMTLNAFVMAVVSFPKVFELARMEIDKLCGDVDSQRMRLPCLNDTESLPYVRGCMKEVLRWRPVVPLIPPHQLTEVLHYKGYCFPQGTNFLINTIASCSRVQDAKDFRPGRWMGETAEEQSPEAHFGFGAGRRICVGYKLAEQTLFLASARLIQCFDFRPVSVTAVFPERLIR